MANAVIWSFGGLCFLVALLAMLGMFLNWCVRNAAAFMNRTEKPKDRIALKVILVGVVGFVIGGFAQPQWDKGQQCRAVGESLIRCFFKPI